MKFYLTINNEQRNKLIESFSSMDNHHVTFVANDVIDVDEEYTSAVVNILNNNYIPFTTNKNEQWFGDRTMKQKIDIIYNLAREVLAMSDDIGNYSDDENEVLEELANVVNIYENTFN